MNKSSFLLLPTVLAVSTSARAQSSPNAARTQPIGGMLNKTKQSAKPRKSLSVDFVFNVNK
jgi:hypothetical protein